MDSNVWIALVGGIIIGFVIEWIIDFLYWRRGVKAFYANESALQNKVAAARQETAVAVGNSDQLRSSLGEAEGKLDSAVKTEAELRSQLESVTTSEGDLREQVEKLLQENGELETKLAATTAAAAAAVIAAEPPAKKRDDLEKISGVGPVYEQKMFGAGIETYADLAATNADDLREVIQPAAWQVIDFQMWIDEAREFAEVVVVDQLPFRLEEIRGIGPTYTRRLNAAGITTFNQLASTSPKRLAEIIQPASWQNVDFPHWIQQAKAFAALVAGDRPPLPLERIKGIGPVSATRLDLAGITTFADLAGASEEQLQEAIGMKTSAFSNWTEQARALAVEADEIEDVEE